MSELTQPEDCRSRPGRTLSQRRAGERGTTMIEMAFVLPLFFLLSFGVFEFARIFYIQLTLQSAVREASRFAITGNGMVDGQGGTMTRAESIGQVIANTAPGLNISPSDITISGPAGSGDPGGPGDLVTIKIDYKIDLLTPLVSVVFPNGSHQFSVRMIARNEPFPEG